MLDHRHQPTDQINGTILSRFSLVFYGCSGGFETEGEQDLDEASIEPVKLRKANASRVLGCLGPSKA
jgi:hypothetical protein